MTKSNNCQPSRIFFCHMSDMWAEMTQKLDSAKAVQGSVST